MATVNTCSNIEMASRHIAKSTIIRIIILAAALAFAGPLQAVTRYVAIDGNDAGGANTCTVPESQCLTITHAMSVAAAAGDVIEIAAGAYTEPLTIDKSLTLQGAGQGITILQAAGVAPGNPGDASERVITIMGAPEVAITGVTVRFGQDINGGGILTGGTLTLTGVSFFSNAAFNEGGGMYNASGSSPTLNNVTFADNTALFGGGMFNIDGSSPVLNNVTFVDNDAVVQGGGMLNIFDSNPVLNDAIFSGNQAGEEGGGIYNFASWPELTEVVFNDNSAGDGGGIFLTDDSLIVFEHIQFENNSADNNGGGVHLTDESRVVLIDARFENNSADNGGGIYVADSSGINLSNVHFDNNNAASHGGGVYSFVSFSLLTDVTFNGNEAGGSGGGMYGRASPICILGCNSLINVVFNNNQANAGGGMFTRAEFSPVLLNVAFNGNAALNNGGGMRNRDSYVRIINAVFNGNAAGNVGGGMHNSGDVSPDIINVTFGGNVAASAGGAMFNRVVTPNISNSVIWDNYYDSGGDPAISSITNVAGADPDIEYSLVQGCNPDGVWNGKCGTNGGNNLADPDPLFIETPDPDEAPSTAGNLRLQAGSPAIDAGDSDLVAGLDPDTDLDGNPRISGDAVDLGTYEWRLLTNEVFSDRFEL